MNAKQVIAAVSIALAGSVALAQEVTPFDTPASTASRADVQAELARAQAEHALSVGDVNVTAQPAPAAAKREDVRAEGRAEARAAVHASQRSTYYSI